MTSTDLIRPSGLPAVSTAAVADLLHAAHHGAAVEVSGITNRSAQVRAGDLFAGVPGSRAHGASFAAQAVASGARAVLTDHAGSALVTHLDVPVLVVDDIRTALGPAAALIYGKPSSRLRMLGITGTSGKTTTAYMVRAMLNAAGITNGLLGTVETLIGAERLEHTAGASFTTPEAPDLHALLAVMAQRQVTHVIMEVSSHALALGRVEGIEFAVAGFANLSHDHMDFHHTMSEYFAAKALLLDGRADAHVLNTDDEWVASALPTSRPTTTISPSGAVADWRIEGGVHGDPRGSRFTVVDPRGDRWPVRLRLPGDFNAANALMALAIAVEAGLDTASAVDALADVQVPGRMERIEVGQPFTAIVDYSHKPAAVEAVLDSVRAQTGGRVVLVLGCGGDRDTAKRPVMGEVGVRGADLLIVTDDNPRSEDPATIRAAMIAGAEAVPAAERGELLEIGDRGQAIRTAVATAGAGDVVVVAGKGHEVGQYVGDEVHEFDDRAELRAALTQGAS